MTASDQVPRSSVLHAGEPGPQQSWVQSHGLGFDPMRLCTATFVAILAWVLTPPLAVLLLATLGLLAQWRARRSGQAHGNCRVRNPRNVVVLLALAWLAAAWATAQEVTAWIG
ncbi:MAG TPA: hypothetical protein VF143_06770 [Candidatus Nanopelagicales bacterium]